MEKNRKNKAVEDIRNNGKRQAGEWQLTEKQSIPTGELALEMRDLSTDLGAFEKFHMQTKAALDAVDDEPPPGEISEHVVKGRTEFTVEGLESYAKYLIAVTACQDPFVVDNRTIRNCSPRNGYILGQPLPNVTRDLILDESVMVQVSNDTALKLLDVFWTDPEDPNSDIMGYQYSFKRNESGAEFIFNARFVLVLQLEQKHCIHSSDVSQASSTGDPLGRFVQIEMELSPGDYSFQICALSLAKKCEFTDPVYFTLQSHASQQVYIILFVLAGILLLVLIALVYILTRPKEVEVKVDTVICLNPIYNEQNLQLEPDFLDLGDVVGAGNFGVVHKASMARGAFSGNVVDPGLWAEKTQEHPWVKYLLNLRGTKLVLRGLRQVKILGPDKSTLGHDDIPVAVKMLKDWHMASSEQRESFFKEIATMRNMTKTAHVVRLLGVVTIREPAMIIMEWMPLGDLQKWLVKRRSDGRGHVSVEEFYQIAAEIADGMACLHHEDVLHRDLAARNCMLSADLTVKVADFGLARKGNYYKIGNRAHLPIRWCAPEVHQDEWKSTKEGDVWSYGVVLWEIATLGDLPYRDRTVAEVAQMTVEERVLERPDGCPLEIYELMLRCWAPNPDSRPSFKTIVEFFLEVASLSTRFLQESHVNNHRCERCTGSSGATEAPTLTRGPRKWSWWNRHWWAQRLPKVRLKRPQRRRHPLPRVSSPDGDTTDDDKHKQEQTDALLQKNAHQAEEPQTVREDDPDDPLLREKHIV
ncbi:unnamed protein product [Cyprideis torosa]|uniref:receptor protein-tyrosine kinase n=1 Tax=Cyprideis torosa TaxID=163714 RepID=A0A7R8W8R9_9CRUS|nr:unnamed protein product [Cyprideis torosa]CAG0886521.1 unnamed protein product [Cyprideis torosa]